MARCVRLFNAFGPFFLPHYRGFYRFWHTVVEILVFFTVIPPFGKRKSLRSRHRHGPPTFLRLCRYGFGPSMARRRKKKGDKEGASDSSDSSESDEDENWTPEGTKRKAKAGSAVQALKRHASRAASADGPHLEELSDYERLRLRNMTRNAAVLQVFLVLFHFLTPSVRLRTRRHGHRHPSLTPALYRNKLQGLGLGPSGRGSSRAAKRGPDKSQKAEKAGPASGRVKPVDSGGGAPAARKEAKPRSESAGVRWKSGLSLSLALHVCAARECVFMCARVQSLTRLAPYPHTNTKVNAGDAVPATSICGGTGAALRHHANPHQTRKTASRLQTMMHSSLVRPMPRRTSPSTTNTSQAW